MVLLLYPEMSRYKHTTKLADTITYLTTCLSHTETFLLAVYIEYDCLTLPFDRRVRPSIANPTG